MMKKNRKRALRRHYARRGFKARLKARKRPIVSSGRPSMIWIKSKMTTLKRAIEIATQAHAGQVDKAGADYIGHPLRVMMKGETVDE